MIEHLLFHSPTEKGKITFVWATDLHFDSSTQKKIDEFVASVQRFKPASLLIAGDISNGMTTFSYLQLLEKALCIPIYFVLGNHDYYFNSIKKTRPFASLFSKKNPLISYLTAKNVVSLTDKTALIGHDGWYDGQAGDFFNSTIQLNDYFYIEELKEITQAERFETIKGLGQKSAKKVGKLLKKAFKTHERVILLTHVPPFEEVCRYQSLPCNPNWAPHFVNQSLGNCLIEVLSNSPKNELLVLCGHAHEQADVFILPNLHAICGKADLGFPKLQNTISII